MLSMRLQLENAMRHVHRAMVMSGATSPDDVQRIFEDAVDTVSSASETAPASPLEQAQALAYEAMEASGRNQIRLARQALAISRDCADVWRVLASRAPYPDGAIPLLREAVAAGARALGDKYFEEHVGAFWGLVETRPYMRAKQALADALDVAELRDEAIAEYRDMLRLNPGDNLGVRAPLLDVLLELNRDDEAAALIEENREDESAGWLYSGALVAFRRRKPDAEARLVLALAANRHVPAFLTGEKEIPELPDAYTPGGVDEAVVIASSQGEAWEMTPGALDWLIVARRGGTGRRRKKR